MEGPAPLAQDLETAAQLSSRLPWLCAEAEGGEARRASEGEEKKPGQKCVFHTELPELPIARHAEDSGSALSRDDRPATRPDRGHSGTHRRGASAGRLSRTERWRPPPPRPGRLLTSAEAARLLHRQRGLGAAAR